jgi:MoaA/NifB/PqqE/SkfB family radical SAM enzyme
LSGGDPLARADIMTVIQGIDSLGFNINLDTTGVQLLKYDPERPISPREISQLIDLIGIPLDGSDDATIYKFRSKNGSSLSKTEKILELLDAENCKISINTVVHSGNIDNLDGIHQIISKYLNVVRWELHQFVALGGGSITNESQFSVDDEAFRQAVDGIVNTEDLVIDAKPRQNKQNFSYLDFDGQFKKVVDGQTRTLFNIQDLSEIELMDAISWSS